MAKQKEHQAGSYKFFKPILLGMFNLYYSPKHENEEYLNVDGPIIVCGNHRHLFDQFMVIGSTKRMLHYMAKKEYFDHKLKSIFFKAAGCIPVDRQNHGGNSKEIAIKVLNDGYALGIFPEGTRNNVATKEEKLIEVYKYLEDTISLKDYKKLAKTIGIHYTQTDLLIKLYNEKKIKLNELKDYLLNPNKSLRKLVKKKIIKQNEYEESLLIPLKFGTVSIAKKTNATIIPYAITGDYKFRSKNLKVTFAKPFKIDDMELEEANKKLYDSIADILKDA